MERHSRRLTVWRSAAGGNLAPRLTRQIRSQDSTVQLDSSPSLSDCNAVLGGRPDRRPVRQKFAGNPEHTGERHHKRNSAKIGNAGDVYDRMSHAAPKEQYGARRGSVIRDPSDLSNENEGSKRRQVFEHVSMRSKSAFPPRRERLRLVAVAESVS